MEIPLDGSTEESGVQWGRGGVVAMGEGIPPATAHPKTSVAVTGNTCRPHPQSTLAMASRSTPPAGEWSG